MTTTIQAIVRNTVATSLTFTGVPSKEVREKLNKAGFSFDGKSKQWYRGSSESVIVDEATVATQIAA